ncbi:Probable LRR receptor-like serine/threonine-protein kinase At3g47570 [Linum perenne]
MELLYLFILISFTSSLSPISATNGNTTDKLSLMDFKVRITHDPLHIMPSWNSTTHFCNWPGITCGRKHRRVTVIDLRSSRLSGSISPAIGNLTFLRQIYLQNNSFSGQIPPEIGRLTRLDWLNLRNNSLRGQIPPQVFNCSNLVFFTFAGNLLSGNMSSLEEIYAYRNHFVGTLPGGLGQLRNFSIVSLYDNGLSGTIPLSTFNSSTLLVIDLELNQLTGQLPSGLGFTFLPQLQFISLVNNRFSGPIPASLSNATDLGTIRLGLNRFSGRFPSLERLNKLRWMAIDSNNFGTGMDGDLDFLTTLTNNTALEILTLDHNNFGGRLPNQIGNLSSKLSLLLVSHNKLYGEIPPGVENLINLTQFEVHNNNFSGTIPSSIGELQNLEGLNLGNNHFSGLIPSSLGNLTRLVELHLETNRLQGMIPTTLGKCSRLLALNISQNSLQGTIPTELFDLSSLSIFLDLSHNRLSGPIPFEVGNLKNLGLLRLSDNMLSGKIPNSLGSCIRLEAIHLDSNYFNGSIPQSLSSLRGIRRFNVSRNNFSGQIPDFFQSFTSLESLDLSYNNFQGIVPSEGIFRNPNSTLISGNVNLCGGVPDFGLQNCNQSSSAGKSNRDLKLKIIISSTTVSISAVLALACFLIYRSRKKQSESTITSLPNREILQVSYEVLFKATEGFSPENEIGRGGSGTVYRGILENPDQETEFSTITVAVKVVNLLQQRGYKSFVAECEALRNARHRNLVKVVTVCSSVDHHGNDFRAIVYEFVENGSLDDWLRNEKSGRSLNLMQRLNIAIDVAYAMEYLHNDCESPIIHCDLKPSNVLLDHSMTGRVSDFGLAKLVAESSADQLSSVGVRGTVGYAPPEYGMGSEISTNGDMYSYGILLLEMFTGKIPTDVMFKDGLSLHSLVSSKLCKEGSCVMDIVDPLILLEKGKASDDDHASIVYKQCLSSILGIGVSCSLELPSERLGIRIVVKELCRIRETIRILGGVKNVT